MKGTMNSFIFEGMKQIAVDKETFIQMHVQPKPRWLPMFLWYKILQRVLVLTEFRERSK